MMFVVPDVCACAVSNMLSAGVNKMRRIIMNNFPPLYPSLAPLTPSLTSPTLTSLFTLLSALTQPFIQLINALLESRKS